MKGSLQFLISVIYTVVIVMMIYFVFQAFAGASSQRESPAQLDVIGRAFSSEGTATIALEDTESLFIGYPRGSCHDTLNVLTGGVSVCKPDAVCICYLFQREAEEPYKICQEKLSAKELSFSEKDDGADAQDCLVADTAGLYRFAFDSAASKVLFYRTAEE